MLRLSLIAFALCLSASSLNADIEALSPAQGTVGTLITIDGSGFGTQKPRVWLSAPGSKKRYRLMVIAFDDGQITAEARHAVEGLLDLHVKPRDAAPLSAFAAFSILSPTVLMVEQAAVSKGETLDLHVGSMGSGRVRVVVGGRRAKILARDDATGHLLVAVRSKPGCHAVIVKNKIGTGTWSSGVAVLGADGQLGEPFIRYTDSYPISEPVRSSDVTLTAPEPGSTAPYQFVGKTKFDHTCRTLRLGMAFDPTAPLPQSWSGSDVLEFEQDHTCCFPNPPKKKKKGGGCGAIFFVDSLDTTLPWRVEILARNGTRIAGAFSATLSGHPVPHVVTGGTFVVDLSP